MPGSLYSSIYRFPLNIWGATIRIEKRDTPRGRRIARVMVTSTVLPSLRIYKFSQGLRLLCHISHTTIDW